MRIEKTVEFDYERFLMGDPMRSRHYDNVLDIVKGHINEARYRLGYKDFNDARKCLDDAETRLKIFSDDATESGIEVNGEIDYMYALVENARRDIDKKIIRAIT